MAYACPGGTPTKPWSLILFAALWDMMDGDDAPLVRKPLLVFGEGGALGVPDHSVGALGALGVPDLLLPA